MNKQHKEEKHTVNLESLQESISRIIDFDKDLSTVERRRNYETYIQYFSDLENEAWDLGFRLNIPEMTGKELEDICTIIVFCTSLYDVLEKEKPLRKFGLEHQAHDIRIEKNKLIRNMEFNDKFYIQMLINETREILQTSEYFSEGHQLRLLNRLEKFQSALHRSFSIFETYF